MLNHVFLILNYNNYQDTLKCVESIDLINGSPQIVIVDNDSKNDAFEILTNEYNHRVDVHVIKTETNLGFARGNNFGYEYIKENLNYDFIHCLNSDVLITELDILSKTEEFNEQHDFYLMGPNILTGGQESSPIGFVEKDDDYYKNIKKLRFYSRVYYLLSIVAQPIMGTHLEGMFNIGTSSKVQKMLNDQRDIVPILSGCYLVFSKQCTNLLGFLYSDITFLYNEESILTHLLMKQKIRKIYFNKDISVIHNHAGSSKGNNKQKAKFVLENLKKMESL